MTICIIYYLIKPWIKRINECRVTESSPSVSGHSWWPSKFLKYSACLVNGILVEKMVNYLFTSELGQVKLFYHTSDKLVLMSLVQISQWRLKLVQTLHHDFQHFFMILDSRTSVSKSLWWPLALNSLPLEPYKYWRNSIETHNNITSPESECLVPCYYIYHSFEQSPLFYGQHFLHTNRQ